MKKYFALILFLCASSLAAGNLKFRIAFSGEHRKTSFDVSFKYILIPTGESATISNLDYNNYFEVCSYYGIPQ